MCLCLFQVGVNPVYQLPAGMTFLSTVAKITDHLYLGGHLCVTPQKMKQHGITDIINLTLDVPPLNDKSINTYKVTIDDVPSARLGVHFDRCADKIHETAKRGGRTFVHCVAGVSRSASICIAYLMKYQRMTLAKAYSYVKSKRSVVRPNPGFFKQLIDYENRLFKKTSVKMMNSAIGMVPDVYLDQTKNMVWTTTYNSSYGR